MDALETTLRPLVNMVNRQIDAMTPARELCKALSGSLFAVRVRGTALAAWCEIDDDGIALSGSHDGEPDVVVTGSILALLRLSGDAGDDAIRDGSVELTGNAEHARMFQRLLRYGRPDLEEELSGVIGDTAAHGIGSIVRGIGAWSREAGNTMRQNLTEYLQEESRALPTRYEVEAHRKSLERLRDDVDRFEAKLRLTEDRTRGDG